MRILFLSRATPRHASTRGSVLMVALIFAAVIGVSLVSYLKLSLNAGKLANRSFYMDGAQNLVDLGFEHVLWALNNENWSGAGFSLRSGSTNQYQATFPSATTYYEFAGGVKGQVKVWVDTSATTKHAVARTTITLGDGTSFTKQAETYIKRRSYDPGGMVMKNKIDISGSVRMDSWNSSGNTVYTTGAARDGARIASASVDLAAIAAGNGDVFGYAAVGGSSSGSATVGSRGYIGPYSSPVPYGTIDPDRITYDFTTSFPEQVAPSTITTYHNTLPAISAAMTIPNPSIHTAVGGVYYFTVPSITLTSGGSSPDCLTIAANTTVSITVTNTSGDVVKTTGQGGIQILSNSTLKMYTAGDVSLAGNGVINGNYDNDGSPPISTTNQPNRPINFQLFGTQTAAQIAAGATRQTIDFGGNGSMIGTINAPNAKFKISGNGQLYGAVVADRADISGNGEFHYDESLRDEFLSNLWGIVKWRELTSNTDRNTYNTQLSF